jgi:hypothetical protein
MFEVELKEYICNPNDEDLCGFCYGGSAAGFAAWRRQDGRFVWVLLSGTVDPSVRLKCGSTACTFYLSFINSIINPNNSFNHFSQVLRLFYSVDFVFNEILKTIIEFRCDSVTFLI